MPRLTSALRRAEHAAAFRRGLRPTDIFLVGHPKSGNTWVAYMLSLVVFGPDRFDDITIANLGEFVPAVHGADHRVAEFGSLPDPRLFRNEWPVYPRRYPRTVYIVRDPRAVILSYYHHYDALHPARLSKDEFVARYLQDGNIAEFEPRLERWDRHVDQWRRRAESQTVVTVRYEDLVSDRLGALGSLVRALGWPVADGLLAEVAAYGGFDAMQRLEERAGAESFAGHEVASGRRFIRAGKTDSWRTELSESSIAAIESELGPVMLSLGYEPSRS